MQKFEEVSFSLPRYGLTIKLDNLLMTHLSGFSKVL